MECQFVAELLPWLLNGTLEETERREVMEHLAGCETCRGSLAETRTAYDVFGQHLAPEALVALAWGETPSGVEPEVVASHLAACPECATELELARTSRRLEEDDRIAVLVPRKRPAAEPRRIARPDRGWRAAALAAGFAGLVAFTGWYQSAHRAGSLEQQMARRPEAPAGAVGAAPVLPPAGATADPGRVAELERKLAETEQLATTMQQRQAELQGKLERLAGATPAGPRLNVPVVPVRPSQDVVRGATAGAEPVAAGSEAVLLLGGDPAAKVYPSYDLEILDDAGKAVWSAAGLRRNADSQDYTLALPAAALKPGVYTIRLWGKSGDAREPAEVYQIRVRPAP